MSKSSFLYRLFLWKYEHIDCTCPWYAKFTYFIWGKEHSLEISWYRILRAGHCYAKYGLRASLSDYVAVLLYLPLLLSLIALVCCLFKLGKSFLQRRCDSV